MPSIALSAFLALKTTEKIAANETIEKMKEITASIIVRIPDL